MLSRSMFMCPYNGSSEARVQLPAGLLSKGHVYTACHLHNSKAIVDLKRSLWQSYFH
jgi:hypothetical protein